MNSKAKKQSTYIKIKCEDMKTRLIKPQQEGCWSWDERAYKECEKCGRKIYLPRDFIFCPYCGRIIIKEDD